MLLYICIVFFFCFIFFFFFKQKTAYEMRISDWSSDVCSSDLSLARLLYPEMRKVMRSLSGVAAAKQIATRGLKGLRGFASIFKIAIAGVEIGLEPEPGLADSGDQIGRAHV